MRCSLKLCIDSLYQRQQRQLSMTYLVMLCAQVIKLIEAVEGLKAQLDVPPTIRQVLNKAGSAAVDAAYLSSTLEMAYQAFDDQCTGTNPRYPVRRSVVTADNRPVDATCAMTACCLRALPFLQPCAGCAAEVR
jgi:hypothetical protein